MRMGHAVPIRIAAAPARRARRRVRRSAIPLCQRLPSTPRSSAHHGAHPSCPRRPTPAPKPKSGPRWRSVGRARAACRCGTGPNGRTWSHGGHDATEFGSARVMSVAGRRGAWLGVVTRSCRTGSWPGSTGTTRACDSVEGAYSLHADLSGRRLELRRGGRVIRRISVAIGRPGSETPTGRFAVTDKLRRAGATAPTTAAASSP